jgi:hypothetical protein
MPDKPVALENRHTVQGRARLRPARAMEATALKELADRIARVPGVARVLVRPATGSLILDFDGPYELLFQRIEAQGIARVRSPAPPPPLAQVAQLGLLQADMALKGRTQNALDLNSAAALLLFFGAAVQLGRGRIAGPATTLAMAALSMLDRERPK